MDLTLWGQIDELAWLCESLSKRRPRSGRAGPPQAAEDPPQRPEEPSGGGGRRLPPPETQRGPSEAQAQ